MAMRDSDNVKNHFFRSNRFFSKEQEWYFRTREGIDCGPFDSHEEAELMLKAFLRYKQLMPNLQIMANHSS
ncbi:MAG: DUF6316 family protein [Pseudomonadota bacterium]